MAPTVEPTPEPTPPTDAADEPTQEPSPSTTYQWQEVTRRPNKRQRLDKKSPQPPKSEGLRSRPLTTEDDADDEATRMDEGTTSTKETTPHIPVDVNSSFIDTLIFDRVKPHTPAAKGAGEGHPHRPKNPYPLA